MIKKILLSIGLITSFITVYGQNNFNVPNSGTGYVRLEGKQFIDGSGAPFYPLLCNWEPQIVYDSPGNYRLSPNHSYGDGITFECTNVVDCDQQILNEFNYIRSLGFNGVRINGLYPKYDFASGNFYLKAVDQVLQKQEMPLPIMTPPFINDAKSNVLYDMHQKILDIASQVNSNNQGPFFVIFNTCGLSNEYSLGNYVDYLTTIHPLYIQYLKELGKRLQGASNLIAYDFWNEPCYSIKGAFTKEEVCNFVSEWVDNVKYYDKHHLTTVGNCWDDVIRFDAAVMKIDFMSPHFYPLNKIYDNQQTPIAEYLDQARGAFYWLGKNAPLPWIIGETGFTATASAPLGWAPNETFGTLSEQKDYAEFITNLTRDCGGSGFSWWDFQDTHNNTNGSDTEGRNYWGLLERDIPCSNPLEPCPPQEKPLITNFFRTYGASIPAPNSANFNAPHNYTNPFNHVSNSNDVAGVVSDNDGNAIKDAMVYGWSWIKTSFDNNGVPNGYELYPHYTFTIKHTYGNPIGNYSIFPFNYLVPNDPTKNYLVHIWMTGVGIENYDEGNWDYRYLTNQSISRQLERVNFGYEGIAKNITIQTSEEHNLRGGESLRVLDTEIENGGISEITAKTSINLNNMFHAAQGSEVRIMNTDYDKCASFPNLRDSQTNLLGNGNSKSNLLNSVKEIQLSFNNEANIQIYPNPNKGIFTVNTYGFSKNSILKLQDLQGRVILSSIPNETKINFNKSDLSKGVYLLNISDENHISTKKVIIN